MPATRSPGAWTRRIALLAVLVLAFWILLAFPEWVGVPVAVVVIVLLSLLGYVLRDRDRLADQLDAAETRRVQAERDATLHAGVAAAAIRRAGDLADQLEKATGEPTPLEYAEVRRTQSWWQE
ncbi:MAG: hypothetical protein LCI03_20635 [Actinobacteria bacterium]|nr:hypothetical protein [Actinomycetota bacterium]